MTQKTQAGVTGLEKYDAFIFDLNGTMIDDMQYHINAWYRILNELGANISMERMKDECYGKNQELLERMFAGRFSKEEKDAMSLAKETQYQQEFKPHLTLIDGLYGFLRQAHEAGIKIAIGSAAIMFNVDFVLDGTNIRPYINAIISADDVTNSKPDPETFLKCAEALKIPAAKCVVFEDSPKGAEAAKNAGMDCIIIKTMNEEEDFSPFQNVVGFINNYNNLSLKEPV